MQKNNSPLLRHELINYIERFQSLDGFFLVRSPRQSTFVCLEPALKATYCFDKGLFIETADEINFFQGNFFELASTQLLPLLPKGRVSHPVLGGYLSYELLHEIEEVPYPSHDPYGIPGAVLFLYKTVVEISDNLKDPIKTHENISYEMKAFWTLESGECAEAVTEVAYGETAFPLERYSNFSKEEYERDVESIRESIRDGDVYQVNLSQRFTVPYTGRPSVLFESLPFSTYSSFLKIAPTASVDEGFEVLSASPELFFHVESGLVRCSPIKGSIERGSDPEKDREKAQSLLMSEKDRAELAMIVDLVRNDLGRVAETGTVNVRSFPRLETLSYIHHLVSDIEARLKGDKDVFHLLKALFPCGSITGAPKVSAMCFISNLEKSTRGIFTGAIGYISSSQDALFSVAIRTGVLKNSCYIFQAGGGIVIDSDPTSEYFESLLKGSSLYQGWLNALGKTLQKQVLSEFTSKTIVKSMALSKRHEQSVKS